MHSYHPNDPHHTKKKRTHSSPRGTPLKSNKRTQPLKNSTPHIGLAAFLRKQIGSTKASEESLLNFPFSANMPGNDDREHDESKKVRTAMRGIRTNSRREQYQGGPVLCSRPYPEFRLRGAFHTSHSKRFLR